MLQNAPAVQVTLLLFLKFRLRLDVGRCSVGVRALCLGHFQVPQELAQSTEESVGMLAPVPPWGFCLPLLLIPAMSASRSKWDTWLSQDGGSPGSTQTSWKAPLTWQLLLSCPRLAHAPSPCLTISCKILSSHLENVTEGLFAFASQQVMN